MKKLLSATALLFLATLLSPTAAAARGFGGGGFHGGGGFGGGGFGGGDRGFGGGGFGGGDRGFGGGGFGGGGFGGGDRNFGGGGFGGGNFGGGERNFGGGNFGGGDRNFGGNFDSGFRNNNFGGFDANRAGGFDAGRDNLGGFGGNEFGNRAGGFGGNLNRGDLNRFLGLPTDAGTHVSGGSIGDRGFAAGPGGAAIGRDGASGHVYQGPGGTTVAHGQAGERGAAVGPNGAAAGERGASGTVVKGPDGNVYAHGEAGERGIAAGQRGVVAGRTVAGGRGIYGANGTHFYSNTYFHSQGLACRRWWNGGGVFGPGWFGLHPWGWYPAGWGAAAWTTAAWNAATWASAAAWLDWSASPAYYNYGDNVTYQDGNVYYGNQYEAGADQYYQQASNLANTSTAPSDNSANWLPLGVFGLIEPEAKKPSLIVQLAVDKQGVVRGNAVNTANETMSNVQGAVDKKTQRICWTVGDNKTNVYETGLYNLTKQDSPALVHLGADRTMQVTLVRLQQNEDNTTAAN